MTAINNHFNDIYSSAYAAEMYDLMHTHSDNAIYWDAYLDMRTRHNSEERYTVLDVGTGTGRVIKEMSLRMEHLNLSHLGTDFIGVDTSQSMLSRAAENPIAAFGENQPSWILGSALDLTAIPIFAARKGQVDLLIFAYSTICYLVKPGEIDQFLSQVVQLLRPGTGRAYVSIHHDSLLDHNEPDKALSSGDWSGIWSKKFPGVVYRSTDWDVKDGDEPKTRRYRYVTEIRVKGEGEEEELLEKHTTENYLRFWDDEVEFQDIAEDKGLRLLTKVQGQHETVYVLALA